MALAREFDAAGNNIEDTSNEEKIQLKKRLATVSTQMWSRLLDEVEGEQNEGGYSSMLITYLIGDLCYYEFIC
jgi:hypothetical protein